MAPFLREGDVVSVELCDVHEVSIGDLVVVERGSTLVLHRAIRREGGAWRTRGDAWSRLDSIAPGERLLARVPGLRLGSLRVPDALATDSLRRALVAALPVFARARGLVGRLRSR